jgi:hypothetical protein
VKYFMYGVLVSIFMAACSNLVYGHEMTPTYPKLRPSHLDNVYVTTMEMFNKRNDVDYYEIGVFDKDMNPIPFVSKWNVINLRYLSHIQFDVYIRRVDVSKATYICSMSKIKKDTSVRTAVSSKICSKFK